MKPLGNAYKEAEVLEGFRALPGGGYVVRITDVIDHGNEAKPYLEIVFDIFEGEYAGYYSDEWAAKNVWAHRKRQYYNDTSLGVFKGFLKAVDEANGTNFVEMAGSPAGLNERELVGRLIGFVVGLEEYETNTGNIGTRPDWFNAKLKPLKDIRGGSFSVPDVKKLNKNSNASAPAGFSATNDDAFIPF